MNSNGGILHSPMYPETIIPNSERSGYEAQFALEPHPSKIYESESSTAILNLIYTSPITLTGFALIYHNLLLEDTIAIRAYVDDSFSTLIVEKSVSVTSLVNTYLILENMTSVQYLQLQIESSQPYVMIGHIFTGTSFQFPHNYSWGNSNEFFVAKQVESSDGGFHFESENGPEWASLQIEFNNVKRGLLRSYKFIVRPGNKIFIPYYTQPECFYGIVPDSALKAIANKAGDKFSFRFWEHALPGKST